MQRLQTCELPNDFRHVCFKDLQSYISIDSFIDILRGYSDVEINEIKKLLGIPSTVYVDKDINMYSTHPVENRAVFDALSKKVDKNRIATVAITGSYKDLSDVPVNLPNPEGLIIQDKNGEYQVYDGSEAMKITLPQSVKDLGDWKDFVVDYDRIEKMLPIRNILLNGVLLPINASGTVTIKTITWKELEEKLKNYITADDLNLYKGELEQLVVKKISVLRTELLKDIDALTKDTTAKFTDVNNSITLLQNSSNSADQDIQSLRNDLQDLSTQLKSAINDISIIKAKLGI